MLLLLQRRGAKCHGESFTEDRDGLVLAQVNVCGERIVLISLGALQGTEIEMVHFFTEDVLVVFRIGRSNKQHVCVGSIGGLEMGEPQHIAVRGVVHRRTTGSLMCKAMECSRRDNVPTL